MLLKKSIRGQQKRIGLIKEISSGYTGSVCCGVFDSLSRINESDLNQNLHYAIAIQEKFGHYLLRCIRFQVGNARYAGVEHILGEMPIIDVMELEVGFQGAKQKCLEYLVGELRDDKCKQFLMKKEGVDSWEGFLPRKVACFDPHELASSKFLVR